MGGGGFRDRLVLVWHFTRSLMDNHPHQGESWVTFIRDQVVSSVTQVACFQPLETWRGVQRCTVVYGGVQCWCTTLYSGVQWCTVVYNVVQWCTVVYSVVQCCTVVYGGVQRCTVLYPHSVEGRAISIVNRYCHRYISQWQ